MDEPGDIGLGHQLSLPQAPSRQSAIARLGPGDLDSSSTTMLADIASLKQWHVLPGPGSGLTH